MNTNKRRCEATAARTGHRCRKWALRGGEQQLCSAHAHETFPGPEERRCTATKANGERCANWAMLAAAEGEERPSRLCNVHGGEINHRPPPERRCTAVRADGQRCRRWTTKGDEEKPTVCHAHAYPEKGNLLRHGFYRRLPAFSDEERATIEAHVAAGQPLLAEVFVVRLKVRALLAYLERPKLTAGEQREAARLAFAASLAVADLLTGLKRIDQERTGFARHLVARTVRPDETGARDGQRQ